ncbi:hypothetical protein [Myroides fluvii]|uniref:hypothetical protein n=1 Tax=Myroides fluvii TaxID=2572594 RepID=UPI00131B9427|nr:hypothetical protein [Myroides fluvii]
MTPISLDLLSENIHNPQTREYFKEILKSYYHESYRSAVVMLYTVTITDLYLKIAELALDYNDQKAEGILDKIKKNKQEKPKDTSWENTLTKQAHESLKLISLDTFNNIEYLKQKRHLCAHPTILNEKQLYSPDKELTRSLIQQMLQEVFIISPLDKINTVSIILTDIEFKKKRLSHLQFKKYFTTTYINKISSFHQQDLLMSFWEIVFYCNSEKCKDNEFHNILFINTLLENRKFDLTQFFFKNKRLEKKLNEDMIGILITSILNKNTDIYPVLDESLKNYIDNTIELDYNLQIVSIFYLTSITKNEIEIFLKEKLFNCNFSKNDTFSKYQKAEVYYINQLAATLDYYDFNDLSNEVIIKFFISSSQFLYADERFDACVFNRLNDFSEDSLKMLISGINSNSQIYGRKKAISTNLLIKEKMLEKNPNFNFEIYNNFL